MASNKYLKARVSEIVSACGIELSEEQALAFTEGNNAELSKLVEELENVAAEMATAQSKANAEKAAAEARAKAAEAEKPKLFYVKEGRSITCKKGVIDSGKLVLPEYVGGLENLLTLEKRGAVERK